MDSRRIDDLAHHRFLVHINDNKFSVMADVQPAGKLIDRQVIPAALASHRDFF